MASPLRNHAPKPPRPERWEEVPTSAFTPYGARSMRAFRRIVRDGILTVIVSEDPRPPIIGAFDWHLSISHPTRYPAWNEIAQARYDLLPDDITMVMFLPPRSEYVNVHKNCFHLHQFRRHEE
jgi:hypothetical protein